MRAGRPRSQQLPWAMSNLSLIQHQGGQEMPDSHIRHLGPRAGAALLVCSAAVALAAGVTKVERVSVSSTGEQTDGVSSDPSLSADGRFVAFYSGAHNLAPGDT